MIKKWLCSCLMLPAALFGGIPVFDVPATMQEMAIGAGQTFNTALHFEEVIQLILQLNAMRDQVSSTKQHYKSIFDGVKSSIADVKATAVKTREVSTIGKALLTNVGDLVQSMSSNLQVAGRNGFISEVLGQGADIGGASVSSYLTSSGGDVRVRKSVADAMGTVASTSNYNLMLQMVENGKTTQENIKKIDSLVAASATDATDEIAQMQVSNKVVAIQNSMMLDAQKEKMQADTVILHYKEAIQAQIKKEQEDERANSIANFYD